MAGVDVLKALEAAAETLEWASSTQHMDASDEARDLWAARAAVAELIEAARRAGRSAVVMHDDRQREVVCIQPADWTALAAALRNVQGGA